MAMISGTFGEILRNRKSVGDFMREADEFEERKRQRQMQEQLGNLQIQQAQKDMDAFDVDSLKSLAAEGLFNTKQGKQMSSEQKAALETMAVLEGQKTKYQADEFGNVKALTQPNAYQQYLMSQVDSNVGGGAIDPLVASRNAVMQRNAEGIQNPYGTLPPTPEEYYGDLQVNDVTPEQAEQIIANMGLEKDAALRMPAKDYKALLEGVPDAGPKTQQLAQDEAVKAAAKGLDPKFLADEQEKQRKARLRKQVKLNETDSVAFAAKRALEEMADTNPSDMGILPEAGPVSYLYSWLGTTGANRVKNAIDTMKSNIGFSKLQEIKEASPTGGAVGQLTEAERETLEKTIASLDQFQNPQDLQDNIKYIYNRFMNMVHGDPEDMKAYAKQAGIPYSEIEPYLFRYDVGFTNIDPETLKRTPQQSQLQSNDIFEYMTPEERALFE